MTNQYTTMIDDFFVPKMINELQKRSILWNRYHENYHNRLLVDKTWDEVAAVMGRDKETVRMKWKNVKDTFKRELRKIKQVDGKEVYTGRWRYFERAGFLKETFLEVSEFEKMKLSQSIEGKDTPKSIKLDDLVGNSNNNFDYQLIKEEIESDYEIIVEEIRLPNQEIVSAQTVELAPPETETVAQKSYIKVANSNEEPSASRPENKRRVSDVSLTTEMENAVKRARTIATEPSMEINEDIHFALSIVPYLKRLDAMKKLQVRTDIQNILLKALIERKDS